MTVETTGLFKAIEDAAKVEGDRRAQTERPLIEYRLPYRMGFFDGAQWALEQDIVQEMVAALEPFAKLDKCYCEEFWLESYNRHGPNCFWNEWADEIATAKALLARIRGGETTR